MASQMLSLFFVGIFLVFGIISKATEGIDLLSGRGGWIVHQSPADVILLEDGSAVALFAIASGHQQT